MSASPSGSSSVPHIALARRLSWNGHAGRDVFAGVTVAAFLVPQVMAYARVAGLSPVAGLRAAVPAAVIYALLGSSRRLSVGPESTTALMTAAVVAPLARGDPTRYAELSASLALVVGGYCVVAALLHAGFVADLLSRPVLVGYLAGLAVTMMVSQLGALTGVPQHGSSMTRQLSSWLEHAQQAHALPLLLAGLALGVSAVQLRLRRLPGPLLAIGLTTVLAAVYHLSRHGVVVVGRLDAGLAAPSIPSFGGVGGLLLPALGVTVVAYADTMLTGRSFARRRDPPINANRELVALGVGNASAGLAHGFPVSSSASRTALADAAGAGSQLYSIVCVLVVVVVAFVATPLLKHCPVSAFAGIVIFASLRLINVAEFRRLASFRHREFLLAIATTVGVLAVGLLYGVLVAVGLSIAETLWRIARPHDAVLGAVPGLAGMHDVDDYPAAKQLEGLVVYRYDSPLFFANAENFRRRALAAADAAGPGLRWFVLNVEANVEVDITALDALDALRTELSTRQVVFALARVKRDLLSQLDAYGLTTAIGREHLFPTLPTAVAAYREAQDERPTSPGPAPAGPEVTGGTFGSVPRRS